MGPRKLKVLRDKYEKLRDNGGLWDLYPHLSGDFEQDLDEFERRETEHKKLINKIKREQRQARNKRWFSKLKSRLFLSTMTVLFIL